MKYLTSDLHFSHKKVVEYTDRKLVTTQQDHDEWLSEILKSTLKPGDELWILGDVVFKDTAWEYIRPLTNRGVFINIIKGNHDATKTLNAVKNKGIIKNWSYYHEIEIKGVNACLFHYPISSWNWRRYGSYHLHGHCVDLETEILTVNGFKKRGEISVMDSIYSVNTTTGDIELDNINEIIDINYTGDVIVGDGKSYDFRYTEDHMVTYKPVASEKINKIRAKDFAKRNTAKFIVGFNQKFNKGINLSTDLIKLMIVIAADGNIKYETNLIRISVKKDRKKKYIEALLSKLGVSFKTFHTDGEGSSRYHFYLPHELLGYNIKGLDEKLTQCNREQAEAIFEAYGNSDGCFNGSGLIIYSKKEREIDILQHLFCINGYSTNKYSRRGTGFSKEIQHQLSVYNRTEVATNKLQNALYIEKVQNERFWCVKTNNKTFIMRRNGVVTLTGNCHGDPTGIQGRILDVGIDNAYNIFGEHKLFSEDEVHEILNPIDFNGFSHHNRDSDEYILNKEKSC